MPCNKHQSSIIEETSDNAWLLIVRKACQTSACAPIAYSCLMASLRRHRPRHSVLGVSRFRRCCLDTRCTMLSNLPVCNTSASRNAAQRFAVQTATDGRFQLQILRRTRRTFSRPAQNSVRQYHVVPGRASGISSFLNRFVKFLHEVFGLQKFHLLRVCTSFWERAVL